MASVRGYVGALAELACSPEGRADRTGQLCRPDEPRVPFSLWTVSRTCRTPSSRMRPAGGRPLPGGGANGEGQTAEEAVADLREALDGWFAEFGVPDELTITVRDVA